MLSSPYERYETQEKTRNGLFIPQKAFKFFQTRHSNYTKPPENKENPILC